ncbi:MAG TPA: GWxTD domain-containing protein [Bacteroidales bacterium]|nr:GWxTD domain-containing protein [Bacteroidales bacterium]HOL97973.1 GWxTD domain-containing protein [Bacteroidales bacterium]HOM36352.1 GWxTD domain-containing protein [Bacteroidales bacterium]HPD23519.1 GWxTD domain-containing protein [Bacteroidales bacterium]HRS99175.1 GWxTD domain-containing protein [Bacteroidales bacterium]
MKKIIFVSILFLSLKLTALPGLEVYFMYATFNSPSGPYLETYMSIIGNSAVFTKIDDGKFQSKIEVTMIFKKNDKIFDFNKYVIESPVIENLNQEKPNFIDLQRISLPNGNYKLELFLKDLNYPHNESYFLNDIINIDYNSSEIKFSDFQLIESITLTKEHNILSKGGYDLTPYISNFYPNNINNLSFYIELYNTDKKIDGEFLVKYYIESFETGKVNENTGRFKKFISSSIIPILGELNISDLPAGNYYLVLEAVDRNNNTLQKTKFFFQRSLGNINSEELANLLSKFDIKNSFSGYMENRDSLILYVSCLRPIANQDERNFIDYRLKTAKVEDLQNFFVQFWLKRNNVDPNSLWVKYKEQVDFVDKYYRTPINRGFQTDRGRVYLQYGAPDSKYISKHEPSAYPYEIWTYNRVGNENNRKFIFYNPHIAGEEYELLHSDLTGEVKTPNWERVLQKRNNTLYDHDLKNADDSWGSRAAEEYRKK